MEFLRRRSSLSFFQDVGVDLNLVLRLSDNSDGSGGLGGVFKLELYRNHAKIWSGGRFLNIYLGTRQIGRKLCCL